MTLKKLNLKIFIFFIVALIFAASIFIHTQKVPETRVKADFEDTVFLEIDADDTTKFNYNGEQVMLKGVNVNNVGALGIWQASNIDNIEVGAGDYQKIAELGANHVRFGISYQWYLNNPTQFYSVLDQHIQWARENNLWMVITNFILPYLGENTDDGAAHPQGGCYQGYGNPCNFWAAGSEAADARDDYKSFIYSLVQHYENNATVAGYDILNEPWSQDETYSAATNAFTLYGEIIDDIIANDYNSTQLFILEPEPEPLSWILYTSYGAGVSALQDMIDSTENRIVLSSHMYEPFSLTHYDRAEYPTDEDGVTWDNDSMTNPSSPDVYPGSVIFTLRSGGTVNVNGVDYTDVTDYLTDYPHDIRNRFGILFAQAELEIPIYIGEWGAQQTEEIDGSGWHTDTFIQYNEDIANLFDDWGVHDAVFEFKAGAENWGLYTETGPQPEDGFAEQVSFDADSPSTTVQPFIDTLSSIWNTITKPAFDEDLVIVQCQNGKLEAGEMCDDGNNANGDGCNITCDIEKKGPVVAGDRNTCQINASFTDFRQDAFHEIDTGSYDPDAIPADSGYSRANQQLKLGNNGTYYHIPAVWFEDVQISSSVTNAYIDFNLASTINPGALTSTIYGLKIGNNLDNYNPDGSTPDRFYVDRNPYQTYLGGDNWVNWQPYSSDPLASPFRGFPHDVLTRSNGAIYQWPKTTASSSWVMPLGSQLINTYQSTPDIGSVLNELIAQSGWTSGNSLGFILIPELGNSSSLRTFYGYDATINTSLGTFSYTGTNTDSTRFAKLYANCSPYTAGLSAFNDSFSLDYNTEVSGDVKDNNGSGSDTNPGSYELVYKVMENVLHGTLEFDDETGEFTYTPTIGYSGSDSFRYVISDLNGGTDDAIVNFTVVGNSLPTVTATILTQGNLTTSYTFSADADDSDGSIVSYLWSKISGPGDVSFGASSQFSTTASFSKAGTYIIQVQVTDDDGGTATDTLNIAVPPLPGTNPPASGSDNSGEDEDLENEDPISSPVSSPIIDKPIEGEIEDEDVIPSPSNNSNSSGFPVLAVAVITIVIGISAVGVMLARNKKNESEAF